MTLFRDQRQDEYDNKDWFFVLEDVKGPGVANTSLNPYKRHPPDWLELLASRIRIHLNIQNNCFVIKVNILYKKDLI